MGPEDPKTTLKGLEELESSAQGLKERGEAWKHFVGVRKALKSLIEQGRSSKSIKYVKHALKSLDERILS